MGTKKLIALIFLLALCGLFCPKLWAEVVQKADKINLRTSTLPTTGKPGDIRYDTSDDGFSFFNNEAWLKLITTDEDIRFEWWRHDTADCTASPCTLLDKSAGVNTLTRSTTGTYSINFSVTFASTVNCVLNAQRGGGQFCVASAHGTGSANILCYTASSGALTDSRPSGYCIGQR